jgi:alpha-beta hydrolase superfamily lysophospholipase
VFLFGHSLGGLIATLYALNAPQNRLRGFVLSGAGLKAGAEVTALLKALAPLLGALLPRQPSFKPDFKFASRDQQVGLRKSADDKIDQKGLPARSGAAGLKAIAAVQSRMESFDKPVLIMHGSEDRWTDPDGSRQLMSRARSSDKSLKLYDGLYHELVSDTERERVWGDIVAWLDARS